MNFEIGVCEIELRVCAADSSATGCSWNTNRVPTRFESDQEFCSSSTARTPQEYPIMPPRIPLFRCLREVSSKDLHGPSACRSTVETSAHTASTSRSFTSSTTSQGSTVTQRRRHQDPYALAQARARKAANLSRQEVLRKERAANLGDPVRGASTPYLQSFDTGAPPDASTPSGSDALTKEPLQTTAPTQPAYRDDFLNFLLSKSELEEGLKHSEWLTTPDTRSSEELAAYEISESTPEQLEAQQQQDHDTAAEALRRIASLNIGSSKDRLRVNIQRCISDFGRHTTDTTLDPRPKGVDGFAPRQEKTPRVGPDTGSSEVQIAILTAKIRTLTTFLEGRGHMDKVNKRNLRLLVHRRAKLLKYLRRKERGGPRFQNVVETLGLTEGTWKGEINIMGPLGGHAPRRLAKLLARDA